MASKVPLLISNVLPTDMASCKAHPPPTPLNTTLLKAVPPEVIVLPTAVALKVTVLAPGVNEPPLCAQLPVTLNVPDGAVNVPEDNATFVVVTSPADPVNVPPLMAKPPLNDCVAVDA